MISLAICICLRHVGALMGGVQRPQAGQYPMAGVSPESIAEAKDVVEADVLKLRRAIQQATAAALARQDRRGVRPFYRSMEVTPFVEAANPDRLVKVHEEAAPDAQEPWSVETPEIKSTGLASMPEKPYGDALSKITEELGRIHQEAQQIWSVPKSKQHVPGLMLAQQFQGSVAEHTQGSMLKERVIHEAPGERELSGSTALALMQAQKQTAELKLEIEEVERRQERVEDILLQRFTAPGNNSTNSTKSTEIKKFFKKVDQFMFFKSSYMWVFPALAWVAVALCITSCCTCMCATCLFGSRAAHG